MSTLMKKQNRSGLPLMNSIINELFDSESFFPSIDKKWGPAVNVIKNDNNYAIELAVPGFNKQDFSITVENGVLTIQAEMKEEQEKSEKNYTRKEFSFQSFSRSFYLPEDANEDAVNANYENGVLHITIGLKEEAKPKKLEVKVN